MLGGALPRCPPGVLIWAADEIVIAARHLTADQPGAPNTAPFSRLIPLPMSGASPGERYEDRVPYLAIRGLREGI
jgi:hypothetical protein